MPRRSTPCVWNDRFGRGGAAVRSLRATRAAVILFFLLLLLGSPPGCAESDREEDGAPPPSAEREEGDENARSAHSIVQGPAESEAWAPAGPMVISRFRGHTATLLLDGRVLVTGGQDPSAVVRAEAEVYDPETEAWGPVGSMATGRQQHTATLLQDGSVLVTGGKDAANVPLGTAEIWSPLTAAWSGVPGTMGVPRSQHTATRLQDGRVLVAGGESAGSPLSSVDVYNPSANVFVPAAAMASGRYAHTATLLGTGEVLVAGGYAGGYLASAELYHPASGTWSGAGAMSSSRMVHAAVLRGSGEVLVAGGVGGLAASTLGSIEMYNPGSGWAAQPLPQMTTPRAAPALALLPNGEVLAAGGYTTGYLVNVETLSAAGLAWTDAGSMSSPRGFPTATVLGDGQVLIVGGAADAELYSWGGTGQPCALAAACLSGFCVDGVCCSTECEDDCHACSTAAGAPSNGTCAPLTGSPCTDGNGCTQTDTCSAGSCVGSNPVVCAALDSCHLPGVCAAATGSCSNPTKPDGASCSDGNACTTSDVCAAGVCGGTAVVCAAAEDCHLAGTCDPATGACSPVLAPNGTSCDDGNPCTTSDACAGGLCIGGAAVTCPPADDCHTAGVCDPATGVCSSPTKPDGTACNDGDPCTLVDTCQSGVCAGGAAVVCGPPPDCHLPGTCNPATGQCEYPLKPNNAICDDGSACTQDDRCAAGVCVGMLPVVCAAPPPCHQPGICDASTGLCSYPLATNGAACDDGDACTQSDTCQQGACVGAFPVVCPAPGLCHLPGTCDPQTGECSDPGAPDGSGCDDGNPCTQADSCTGGVCQGEAIVCPAPDGCHLPGACDPASGLCDPPVKADGEACDDGDACTQEDQCQSGVCAGGAPVVCFALDTCHEAGVCDPATGLCDDPVKVDGSPCLDEDPCTADDACVAGVCAGAPLDCPAPDECHLPGTCQPDTGECAYPEKDDVACSDATEPLGGGCACTSAGAAENGGAVWLALAWVIPLLRRRGRSDQASAHQQRRRRVAAPGFI